MRHLKEILTEALNLNSTQKGIIASMAIAPTPQMAYGVLTGARNAVSQRGSLERAGYIKVNDVEKTAVLTNSGRDILTSENLLDDSGNLTDRGEELVSLYRKDRTEWEKFESFKHFV